MLNTQTCTFVSLSDVMEYMGYGHLAEEPDIFADVSFGDSAYTIMTVQWVLDALYDWLDTTDYQEWTDNQAKRFAEKADELTANHTFVDMES